MFRYRMKRTGKQLLNISFLVDLKKKCCSITPRNAPITAAANVNMKYTCIATSLHLDGFSRWSIHKDFEPLAVAEL